MNSKAAVFKKAGDKIKLIDFKVPDILEEGAILCKVSFCTICGSDLHTISGKRKERFPLYLVMKLSAALQHLVMMQFMTASAAG